MKAKVRDVVRNLQLRYGFGVYKKIESTRVEATRFSIIWNEIVRTFREEDIVSDLEVELLEVAPSSQNVRVIWWPCLLLCNESLLSLNQATELESDKELWLKICKN